jgi:RND family efflux transporter MFP subunit
MNYGETSMTNANGTNTGTSSPAAHPAPQIAPASDEPGIGRGAWLGLIAIAAVIAAVVVYGILKRSAAERALANESKETAIQEVAVTHPTTSALSDELALPGNTQAFVDTPIYARTNGYLKNWYFDIGAHVHKGQLLAVIETPELDQQLQSAQADLKTAQATLDLANTTSARYQNLLKTNSVSKQETDVVVSGAEARKATVDAAEANVRRLEQLQGFEKVYAPFDGIITARNTDIGALIDAGQNSTPQELFHMTSVGKLRVFVAVPEAYSPDIKDGDTATLTLDEYAGQKFIGRVARNSNAINLASRTLNVEVDVDNPQDLLLPGAYVFVHFKVPMRATAMSIPSNALLFRAQGLQVAIVRNGTVHLQRVTIGSDQGATVEISNGLQASDEIVLNPSDSIAEGNQVLVADGGGTSEAGKGSGQAAAKSAGTH